MLTGSPSDWLCLRHSAGLCFSGAGRGAAPREGHLAEATRHDPTGRDAPPRPLHDTTRLNADTRVPAAAAALVLLLLPPLLGVCGWLTDDSLTETD